MSRLAPSCAWPAHRSLVAPVALLAGVIALGAARHAAAEAFVWVDEIPRTTTGKFAKVVLRERFADWSWER